MTHLPKSVEDVRTVKELLESGYFKKNNQGVSLMYLILEKHFPQESFDTELQSSPIKSTPHTRVKKEKNIKKKNNSDGLRLPTAKKEKLKVEEENADEPAHERKRAISQLSDVQEARSPTSVHDSTEIVPYSLRSKR